MHEACFGVAAGSGVLTWDIILIHGLFFKNDEMQDRKPEARKGDIGCRKKSNSQMCKDN